jgi:hypothetical protein
MTRRRSAVLAFALVVATSCSPSSKSIQETSTELPQQTSTTVARRIPKLTGGEGDKFCAAFNDATAMLAVTTAASLGLPEITVENELIVAPALLFQLDTMSESTPAEISGGVRSWRDRTNKAVVSLKRAGVSEQQLIELTQQVLGLTVSTIDSGPIVDQIAANVERPKIVAAESDFAQNQEPLAAFMEKLNGSLGGELVGQARERALQQFPCLAAIDASSDGAPSPIA